MTVNAKNTFPVDSGDDPGYIALEEMLTLSLEQLDALWQAVPTEDQTYLSGVFTRELLKRSVTQSCLNAQHRWALDPFPFLRFDGLSAHVRSLPSCTSAPRPRLHQAHNAALFHLLKSGREVVARIVHRFEPRQIVIEDFRQSLRRFPAQA